MFLDMNGEIKRNFDLKLPIFKLILKSYQSYRRSNLIENWLKLFLKSCKLSTTVSHTGLLEENTDNLKKSLENNKKKKSV